MTTSPRVEIIPGPIPEGSIICLFDVYFGEGPAANAALEGVMRDLYRVAGHTNLLLLLAQGSGQVTQVAGPEEAVALVRAKLAEAGIAVAPPVT